jgi:hypothetical protein
MGQIPAELRFGWSYCCGRHARPRCRGESQDPLVYIRESKGLDQDFATISYSVPGYFESPDPSINIYKNPAGNLYHNKLVQAKASITIQKLNDEVLFRIPDPASIVEVDEVQFLDVSARKLALVVVPPHSTYEVKHGDGLKVVQGRGTSARPYEFTVSITDCSSGSPLD